MYGRQYGGRELRFEASGGLLHDSLVMQDKETDSYWSIMTGESLSGGFKGTRLEELPVGRKATWKDWRRQHPGTLVLSVDGVEHLEDNPYDDYFASPDGPRGARAADPRLPTKQPVFSFHLDGRPYAVPFEAFEGGAAFEVGDRTVFLYRPKNAALFDSSVAFVSDGSGFERSRRRWRHPPSGGVFDPKQRRFDGESGRIRPLDGFDTFWFNWSMANPGTRVLVLGGG